MIDPTLTLEALIAAVLEDTATEWGSSRWATLRRCPVAHDLRYHLKLVAGGPRPIHFGVGTLCHAAIRFASEAGGAAD
jgi:hypothetical protein